VQDRPNPVSDRPLGILAILDGSFAALRQRPKELFFFSILSFSPLTVLSIIFNRDFATFIFDNPVDIVGGFTRVNPILLFLAVLLSIFTAALSASALSKIVFSWFDGHEASIMNMIKSSLRPMTHNLFAVLVLIPYVVAVPLARGVLSSIVVLISIIVYSLLSAFVALATSIAAVEEVNMFASILRSSKLVVKRYLPTSLILMLMGLTSVLFYWAIRLLFSSSSSIEGFWFIINLSVYFLVFSLLFGYLVLTCTLIHIDHRYRYEGLDILLRAEKIFS